MEVFVGRWQSVVPDVRLADSSVAAPRFINRGYRQAL